LLRAVAGLWDIGNGHITRPADDDVYFLPQRPYCTVGTLKDQLLYPCVEYDDTKKTNFDDAYTVRKHRILKEAWTDEDLLNILDQVNLYDVAVRSSRDGNPLNGLYSTQDWSNQLSLGEQQRLAFGRLLVNKPTFVILDEAVRIYSCQSTIHSFIRISTHTFSFGFSLYFFAIKNYTTIHRHLRWMLLMRVRCTTYSIVFMFKQRNNRS
jgi:ABC-type uncharacterized transport system fused permease/ATPase subunit